MSEIGYYVAYPASQELHSKFRDFIALMKQENPQRHDKLLSQIMTLLTNETLDAYLTGILNTSGLGGTQKKLIKTADAFIKKTAQALIKQVTKKMNIKEQRQTAEHFDSCLLSLEGENQQPINFIAYPISKPFYQQIISGHNTFLEQGPEDGKPIIIENQKAITNQMVFFMVERLIAIISFGPLLTKIINVGIEKSVQLTHSTLEKTFTAMTKDEMAKTNQYVATMLIMGPEHNAMTSQESF